MKILLLFFFLFVVFSNLNFFIFLVSEPRIIPTAFIDLFNYFRYKKYNLCKEYGHIRLNCASGTSVFGSGKTLDIVKRAVVLKRKYDGLTVYDKDKQKYVVQHIHLISNVELYGVDYIPFKDISQLVDIDKYKFGSMDVTIFILDESGAIFNSRDYKKNISPEFLTSLLQSRKNKIALYMTSQRFIFTDKILREVTSVVNQCKMFWRIVRIAQYDAYELENALNDKQIKPIRVSYWLATDKDYALYNSYQLIETMRKEYVPGQFLDTNEILQKASGGGDIERVTSWKRKFRKK